MYILDLSDIGDAGPKLVGGKAANLARLIKAGFQVPPGFVITTGAYHQATGDRGQGTADVRTVSDAIMSGTMPAELEDQVHNAYSKLAIQKTNRYAKVAVRSSATAEDLAGLSFAGQYESYLNIGSVNELLAAVRQCWASLWSERAAAYRARNNMGQERIAMAVVVQRMVDAESAGVLFTVDPVSGSRSHLLANAVAGLGEGLASGRMQPDEYRIERSSFKAEINPSTPLRTGKQKAEAILSGEQIRELARTALEIEKLFGAPQDIEWAFQKGRLHILQSRNVTAFKERRTYPIGWGDPANKALAGSQLVFWCNWNTRENMAYPLKPMAWSFFNDILVPEIMKVLYGIGPGSPLEHHCHFIDLVDGRAYWNMTLLAGHPFSRTTIMKLLGKLDMEAYRAFSALAAEGIFKPARLPIPWWSLMRPFVQNALTFLSFPWLASPKWIERRCASFWAQAEEYVNLDLDGRSTQEIFAEARRYGYVIAKFAFPLLIIASKSLVGISIIERLIRKWPDIRSDDLLAGIPGNKTTETALELFKLSMAPPSVREIFTQTDITTIERVRQIDAELGRTGAGRDYLGRIGKFLADYGHRGMKDLDVGYPSWKEDPTYVYQMIASYMGLGPDDLNPLMQFDRAAAKRQAVEREIERRLSISLPDRLLLVRRWLFRWARGLVHDFLPWRENEKFYGIKVFPGSRRIIAEAGRRYAKAGILEQADDIFYLTIPEVEQREAGAAPPTSEVREMVKQRKAGWERQVLQPTPFIVRSDWAPWIPEPAAGDGRTLHGVAASSGTATGLARIIREPSQAHLFKKGEILVAPYTEPGWAPLFLLAGGLVMEVGGAICHGAIVAREYGIPAVVGVKGAAAAIKDGDRITVDGNAGTVTRH